MTDAAGAPRARGGARRYFVSDLRMPRLDGPGLSREVGRRHPALLRRFVFMTGDALNPEIRALLEDSGVPTFVKPFAMDEVRQIVRRVLGERRCPAGHRRPTPGMRSWRRSCGRGRA
ncbi:MAG: hypothetical protein Q8Q58_02545 [Candidatus Rokubacteria bacterium]|nr:hypothetical protein [Candidatus Rokubacteria bacterium]